MVERRRRRPRCARRLEEASVPAEIASTVDWLGKTIAWAEAEELLSRWQAQADATISKMSCWSCFGVVRSGTPSGKLRDGWKRKVFKDPPPSECPLDSRDYTLDPGTSVYVDVYTD